MASNDPKTIDALKDENEPPTIEQDSGQTDTEPTSILKKPDVPKKPKKRKPKAAKRQKPSQSNETDEPQPVPAPRTKAPTRNSTDEVEEDPTENQPFLDTSYKSAGPQGAPVGSPVDDQPVFSSQFSRQSAVSIKTTGDSESQVQTFNFQQPVMAEYDEKQPSPTGFYGWLGFGCAVFSLACLCISFASPYWMQTYPMSFNTFRNMGLWELCMHDYMHHKDDSQTIYDGCWWVFNREEKYWKLREWVLPRK